MAWWITSRRRHETRSPAPAIVLRYQAGNVILGAWDNASACHPETRSSASRMAVHSAILKRETRRAESRLVKREMRREESPFQAAWWRHGGGMVAVWLGLQGVLGGGSPARWYEQLCGGPGALCGGSRAHRGPPGIDPPLAARPATGRPPERVGSDAPGGVSFLEAIGGDTVNLGEHDVATGQPDARQRPRVMMRGVSSTARAAAPTDTLRGFGSGHTSMWPAQSRTIRGRRCRPPADRGRRSGPGGDVLERGLVDRGRPAPR
jgi:hypothetical protein